MYLQGSEISSSDNINHIINIREFGRLENGVKRDIPSYGVQVQECLSSPTLTSLFTYICIYSPIRAK